MTLTDKSYTYVVNFAEPHSFLTKNYPVPFVGIKNANFIKSMHFHTFPAPARKPYVALAPARNSCGSDSSKKTLLLRLQQENLVASAPARTPCASGSATVSIGKVLYCRVAKAGTLQNLGLIS
jgi:hypothetical protein